MYSSNQLIRAKAEELGFSFVGFAQAEILVKEGNLLSLWLQQGLHAGMQYMERYTEIRKDTSLFLPGSRSVITVLLNYYSAKEAGNGLSYRISRYALGRDYHKVMKAKLHDLSDFLHSKFPGSKNRIFADSAPVMEKVWATLGGLGWIGKNTCLINRNTGSYCFLGGIVTNITLEPDKQETDHCGNCRRCIDACPSGALTRPYILDANKCISYLTIEHKGEFPENNPLQKQDFIFGCDVCQEVCPWNRFSVENKEEDFQQNVHLRLLSDIQLEKLSEEEFINIFKNSAIRRTGYNGLLRNVSEVRIGRIKRGINP